MSYLKLWAQETIHGSTLKELEPDERSVWFLFLCLANFPPILGQICIEEKIPYTDKQLVDLLHISKELLIRAKNKLASKEIKKIFVDNCGVIHIINWKHYQSSSGRVYNWRKKKSKKENEKSLFNKDLNENETPFVTDFETPNVTGKNKNKTHEESKQIEESTCNTTKGIRNTNINNIGEDSEFALVDDSIFKKYFESTSRKDLLEKYDYDLIKIAIECCEERIKGGEKIKNLEAWVTTALKTPNNYKDIRVKFKTFLSEQGRSAIPIRKILLGM